MKRTLIIIFFVLAIAVGLTYIEGQKAAENLNQGNTFFKKGDYQAALKCYDQAIHTSPKYADAYFNRGLIHYRLEAHEKAVADFTRVIELKPPTVNVYCCRGEAYRENGDLGPAYRDFCKALEMESNSARALGGIAWIYGAFEHGSEVVPKETALAYAQKAVKLKENAQNLMQLAAVYAKTGDFTKSVTTIDQAIKLEPANNMLPVLKKAFSENCHFPEISRTQSLAEAGRYFEAGDYMNAIAYCNKALIVDNRCTDAYVLRAMSFSRSGNYHRALEDYDMVIGIQPGNPEPYYMKGSIYLIMKDLGRAMEQFNKTVELDPDHMLVHNSLAMIYGTMEEGDRYVSREKALDSAKKSIQSEETMHNFWILGMVCSRAGLFADAVKAQEKTIELDPGNAKHKSLLEAYKASRDFIHWKKEHR